MEILLSASIGLGSFNGAYYLQCIVDHSEDPRQGDTHYWVKIPTRLAQKLHQDEQLEVYVLPHDPTK